MLHLFRFLEVAGGRRKIPRGKAELFDYHRRRLLERAKWASTKSPSRNLAGSVLSLFSTISAWQAFLNTTLMLPQACVPLFPRKARLYNVLDYAGSRWQGVRPRIAATIKEPKLRKTIVEGSGTTVSTTSFPVPPR